MRDMETLTGVVGVGTVVLAILFVTAGPAGAQEPAQPAGVNPEINPQLVMVNGDPVYASDISIILQNMVAQQRAVGEKEPDPEAMVPMAVKRMVETKLLAQEARRRGYEPDPKRVDRMLDSIIKNAGGREELDKNLAKAGTDYARLRLGFEEMDVISEMVNSDIRAKATVKEQEVLSFYESNPELFEEPEHMRARHVLIRALPSDPPEKVAAARAKAKEARERVLAGEDFAVVAKEMSQDPSANTGGDVGYFAADMMMPEFSAAAFALEKGEISQVVRTGLGFHVIKAEDRRPAGMRPLEEVRQRIEGSIKQYKTTEVLGGILKTLLERAEIVPAPGSGLSPELFEEPSILQQQKQQQPAPSGKQ